MTVAMLVTNPAGSRELYERVLDTLDRTVPLGGILHVAGPGPEGGWRVLEIWNSPEEAERFLSERLAPALRAAGFDGPPPTAQLWPVLVHEAARNEDHSGADPTGDAGA
jgi:hypothetical protein